MPGVATIDPKAVIVNIGGAIIGGYADGTFLKVDYESDFWNKVTGADGLTTRIKQNNDSGTLTLTLKQSSLSNDILDGFVALDYNSNAGIVALLIKDLLGTTLVKSAYSWVRKPSAVEYGKEVTSREWNIDCASLKMKVGGNFQFGV